MHLIKNDRETIENKNQNSEINERKQANYTLNKTKKNKKKDSKK